MSGILRLFPFDLKAAARQLSSWLLPILLVIGVEDAWANTVPKFSVGVEDGIYWLFDPGGEAFFSLGINVVNRGEDQLILGSGPRDIGDHEPASVGYQASFHYDNDRQWAAVTSARLHSWGFNTIGGWSDWDLLRTFPGTEFAHTVVLHLGSVAGAPWLDLWDPGWLGVVHGASREDIRSSDRRVIGYYSDNELDWWRGALFRETLGHPPSSEQRRRLVSLLREEYQDDWERLLHDFETDAAASFEELEQSGQVYLRPGSSGIRSYRRFLAMVAAHYYRATSAIIRRQAPRTLLLGDRYRSSYYPELVQSAAAEVDIVSTNLKPGWNDGTFPRFYLESLHALSGKPIIVSEIYLAATENGSGNRNLKGGFPTVLTQEERAAAARRSLSELARLPYVVGTHWFQFYDEPPVGRFDGEDFNMGLVDIENRPYSDLIDAFSKIEMVGLHKNGHTPRPDATQGVPPAPAEPAGHWKPFEALREWDRERGFVPASSIAPFADLYVAWSPSGLWLGLYALDMSERHYYRDRVVPETDRMRWRLTVNGSKPAIDIRMGTALPGVHCEQGALGNTEYRTLAHDTRAIAVFHIPAASLGSVSLNAGDTIQIDSVLDSQARAERVTWAGSFRLAD